jgi:hypothetical protein
VVYIVDLTQQTLTLIPLPVNVLDIA